MARNARLGGKIRRLRGDAGLNQVQLAARLGISASYLNLIEHNQRPLTVPLLLKLSGILQVDLQMLSEDEEGQILADLGEVLGDPMFADRPLGAREMGELVATSPAACQAMVALYRAYRGSREDLHALGERLSEDPFLAASIHQLRTLLTSIRSFSEILHDNVDLAAAERKQYLAIVVGESERLTQTVNELLGFLAADGVDRLLGTRSPTDELGDFLQGRGNYFEDIEVAAQTVRDAAGLDTADSIGALTGLLFRQHGVRVEFDTAVTNGENGRNETPPADRLVLPAGMPQQAAVFHIARRIGELRFPELFDRYVADPQLTNDLSRQLCRNALAKYFAAAVLMPYDQFLRSAQEVRYDIELLQQRYHAGFEQVCHRLATLHRPGALGVPFHFLRVDIAGNISKWFSGSGVRIPRYGGVCPRWNVHAAFMTPGRIDTQIAEMPDGTRYFCLAKAIAKPADGHGSPRSNFSVAIGCEISYARQLVYADGIDLAGQLQATPVGTSCRVCERIDCGQRALPSLVRAAQPEAAGQSASRA